MAIQRLRQGIRALFAFAQPIETDLAARYLTPDQLALFGQMRRGERLHSLNVLRSILAQSSTTPSELAVAALLHDVGKTRYPLAIWQKSLAVIVHAFAPSTFERLSHGDARVWWRRAFVVSVAHPAWSAEMLAQAGASDDAIWLVAHHADDAERWKNHTLYPLLKRLQMADDAN